MCRIKTRDIVSPADRAELNPESVEAVREEPWTLRNLTTRLWTGGRSAREELVGTLFRAFKINKPVLFSCIMYVLCTCVCITVLLCVRMNYCITMSAYMSIIKYVRLVLVLLKCVLKGPMACYFMDAYI